MGHQDKKYELSLWQDDPSFGERRVCILASEIMDSPAKAFNISLNRKTNGEKTLTFSILAKYYDQELLEFITNPYLSLLSNERKVKLCKNEYGEKKWYDFVIKGVAEDSSSQVYTYTAKDQHIQELAKSGFELEFDKELQNNTGTKEYLAEEILKGTDWGVEKGDNLWEYSKEPIYSCTVDKALTLYNIEDHSSTTPLTKSIIFIPYSELISKEEYCQVIVPTIDMTDPSLNDEGVLNRDHYAYFDILRYGEEEGLEGDKESGKGALNKELVPGIWGEKLIRTQNTIYDKAIGQYVKIYSKGGENYYGFTKTEYFTPELVENLITNGEGEFINDSGWYGTDGAKRELSFEPDVSKWNDNETIASYISVIQRDTNKPCYIVNTGLFDRRMQTTGFVAGQKYFFQCNLKSGNVKNVKICEYTFDNEGRYIPASTSDPLFEGSQGVLTCQRTITAKEFKKTKFGIFIYFESNATIESCLFYRVVTDKNGNKIMPGSVSALEAQDLIKTHYYYYLPSEDYVNPEDIVFEYEGYEEQEVYTPVYDGFEKKRTITGKESNRYNLLQGICEQFECWLDIEVDHYDNGGIIPNKIENGQVVEYHKRVSFREYIGKKNHAGFKYGVNLKSIKRNIDSNQIVTKMITKDNSNEFAKNGFCSIARAPSNPSGTNVIYNFDYYISQDLLDDEEVSKALYLTSQSEPEYPDWPNSLEEEVWKALPDIIFHTGAEDWGLYSKLNDITSKTQTMTEEQISISKNITSLKASVDVEQARLDGAESSLTVEKEGLEKLTGYTYEYFLDNPAPTKHPEPEGGELDEEQKEWNRFVYWALSDKVREYKIKIRHLKTEEKIATERLGSEEAAEGLKFELKTFQDQYNLNIKKLEYYNKQRKNIEQEFYQKYARFIQEGSWISEDYIDDELYYLDALATSYTSSRPKVSYTIDVFDLAPIENYENYEFQIGDKTFMENYENHVFQIGDKTHVEDPDFFGYDRQTVTNPITGEEVVIRVPHREEVVVNEMTEGIDDITKNAIKVQNYKTQFDDLFQRIAATTESLQYNTGRYERGAKAVEPDGSISHKALQQAVTENGLAISNAGAQTVTIDEQGVITTDKALPNKKVRIIGGGIYVTKDGGETWETGITGDGINANVITTGQLNAGEINIMTGDTPSHRWDSKGITAYRTTYSPNEEGVNIISSINNNSFVRLDEFGLYGISNEANFDARTGTTKLISYPDGTSENVSAHGIAKIQRDSLFSLTQDGLTIGKQGYGLKATDEGIAIGEMLAADGSIKKEAGFKATSNGLTIGNWTVDAKSLSYFYDNGADIKDLFLAPEGLKRTDISKLNNEVNYTIYSNGNFGITTEGKLHAQDAWIGGHIEANSGNIGGIEISSSGIYCDRKILSLISSHMKITVENEKIKPQLAEDKIIYYYYGTNIEKMVRIDSGESWNWYLSNEGYRGESELPLVSQGVSSEVVIPAGYCLLIAFQTKDAICNLTDLDETIFSLGSNGHLYAQNADISGTINADSGTIGGIKIEEGGLTSAQNVSQLAAPEERHHSSQKNSSTSIKISNYGSSDARAVRYYKLTGQDAEVKVTLNKYGKNINLVAIVENIPTNNVNSFPCSYAQVLWTGSVLLPVKKDQYILVSSDIDGSDWGTCEIFPTGFSISSDGRITANNVSITGVLQAGVGSMIGSFITTESALCFGSSTPSKASMFISSTGESATITGVSLDSWAIGIGSNFGVTNSGEIYAKELYLTGETWEMDTSRLEYNTTFYEPGSSLLHQKTFKAYLQKPGYSFNSGILKFNAAFAVQTDAYADNFPFFVRYNGLLKATSIIVHPHGGTAKKLVFKTDGSVTWENWNDSETEATFLIGD